MTFATYLTLFRIIALVPLTIGLLAGWYWLAFILFVLAALTDFFDGWIARKYDQVTDLGTMLDPIADKLMIATVPLALAGAGVLSILGILASLAILWREFLIAGLREFLGKRGVAVPVTTLAKYKTTLQLIAFGLFILLLALNTGGLLVAELLITAAAVLTWVTGWQYLKVGMQSTDII